MSHIDTLKIYQELISGGMTADQAQIQVNAFEAMSHSFFNEMKEWLKDAKADFASQKLISILGALILAAGMASIGLLWNMSIDIGVLKAENKAAVHIEKIVEKVEPIKLKKK